MHDIIFPLEYNKIVIYYVSHMAYTLVCVCVYNIINNI